MTPDSGDCPRARQQRQLDALCSALLSLGVLVVQVKPRWKGPPSLELALWVGIFLLLLALSLSAWTLPTVYRRGRGIVALFIRAAAAALPHVGRNMHPRTA